MLMPEMLVSPTTGEFAIGVSFAFSGVKQIMEGYPIKLVIPSEGVRWTWARLALDLRMVLPGSSVAVATGRALLGA